MEIAWSRLDDGASLRVHNAGGPLGEEERERAFERFFRRVLEPSPARPRAADRRRPWHGGRRSMRGLANGSDGGVVAEVEYFLAGETVGHFADS